MPAKVSFKKTKMSNSLIFAGCPSPWETRQTCHHTLACTAVLHIQSTNFTYTQFKPPCYRNNEESQQQDPNTRKWPHERGPSQEAGLTSCLSGSSGCVWACECVQSGLECQTSEPSGRWREREKERERERELPYCTPPLADFCLAPAPATVILTPERINKELQTTDTNPRAQLLPTPLPPLNNRHLGLKYALCLYKSQPLKPYDLISINPTEKSYVLSASCVAC